MDLRYTFNEDEKNYDSVRPGYPAELFNDIISYSGADNSSECLEIGAGTGQATEPFLEKGCKVTAIDLGENLCSFVADKFRKYDKFSVINDDFMNYKSEQYKYDLIFSATAFHWLPDTAYEKVKTLLKTNGTFALFRNHPYPNRTDDESNLINREVYKKYRPESTVPKEFDEKDCKKIVEKLKNSGFRNIETKLYRRTRTLKSTDYIKLLNTYSDHIALPQEMKQRFDNEMKEKLDRIGGYINIYDTIDLYLANR